MRYIKKRCYEWSHRIGYLVGLMASDGCLSKDGRHLDLTSIEIEQLLNFNIALGRDLKIGTKSSGNGMTGLRVQFSDVALYDFLVRVGLTPNKSKTIGHLNVPDEYFFDFLRGIFDGDGTTYGFWDKRWKSSFVYYISIASASKTFLEYLSQKNRILGNTIGGSIRLSNRNTYTLSYGKADSVTLFNKMYHSDEVLCLQRKREKIQGFIETDKTVKI